MISHVTSTGCCDAEVPSLRPYRAYEGRWGGGATGERARYSRVVMDMDSVGRAQIEPRDFAAVSTETLRVVNRNNDITMFIDLAPIRFERKDSVGAHTS